MAAGVRRLVPLPRNARPVDHHRRDQARHVPAAADGPPAVRRRGLREDRVGDAGDVQGGRRRLPGGGAGAHHAAVRAAPAHVHRADGGVSLRDCRPVAFRHAAAAGRHHPPLGGRLAGHRHRHAPLGAARRSLPQPRAGDYRRGAAVRRGGEGAAEGAAADRRRADDDGHAHPADPAHGPAGPARHLEPGDAAGRPPGRGDRAWPGSSRN